MRWIKVVGLKLRSLLRPARVERELDDEMRHHLERQVDENVAAGMSPEEARFLALRDFGGVEQRKEECRDARGVGVVDGLRQDLRYALRILRKNPGFTLVALLSIGLGVGANSAIFSLVDQALLRQLPVREPERLVLLSWNGAFVGRGWGSGDLLSHPMFLDLKADNQVFDGVFCRHPTSVYLSAEGTPEPTNAEIVSGSYFDVLGVRPALGRLFDESDDVQPGAHPVVVLSFDYWKNHLGERPDIVGRKVRLNGYPMTVVGVAARGFHGIDWAEAPSLWIPTMMKKQATPDFDWLQDRRGRWLHVFGRLKPGLSLRQAQAALEPRFKAMLVTDTQRESWPVVSEKRRHEFLASTLDVLPASQGRSDLRGHLERPLLVLLAATSLVLLLACLNVANLSLAHAFARRRETALRLALGASRRRIIRELLAQSGLLALAGGALGVLLARLASSALVAFLPSSAHLDSSLNPRVFLFALGVALATGLSFGLVPAFESSRTDLGLALKADSPNVAGGIGLRQSLVVGQVALALVLLIGTGLFVRTLSNLRARGAGFDTTNLVSFRVDPSRNGYDKPRSKRVLADLLAALRNQPEVQSAGLSATMLLSGGSWNQHLTIESGTRSTTDLVHCNAITPGFFESLGVPVLSGRGFDDRDSGNDPVNDLGAPASFRSVIVNESFARHYFGDRSPLGARLGLGDQPNTKTDLEIVGVVKTFSYRGLRETEDQAYVPFLAGSFSSAGFYVRTRTSSPAAFAAIRGAVQGVDPALPVEGLRTLDDQLDRALGNERLLATLATAFAGLALLLAAVGLYGVTAFVVSRHTREIGLRMALGAQRGDVLRSILGQAARLTLMGVVLGTLGAFASSRLLTTLLYGVKAGDPLTYAGAAAVLALVTLAATFFPAHRASRVDPMVALRHD
jgi:predicted permease